MNHVTQLLIAVFAMFAACRSPSDREAPQRQVTRAAEPSDAIDQKLMVPMLRAKNLHHKAKVLMSEGDTASAIASVREILSVRFPPSSSEGEDIRNDARALLGELLVGQGRLDEAMTVVTEGLAQSQRESFYVANLYTVKGQILEAHATALEADPANKPRVVELRHAAIEAFDTSNKIDAKLQDALLESP